MALKFVLLLSYVLVILPYTLSRTVRCGQENDDSSLIDLTARHESFLMMPQYRPEGMTIQTETFGEKLQLSSAEDRTCTEILHPDSGEDIAVSCPWHYVMNVDQNREPERLVEAVCNCNGRSCVHGPPNSRCLPLKYYISVKRFVQDGHDGVEERLSIEPITVGCTCAVPTTDN